MMEEALLSADRFSSLTAYMAKTFTGIFGIILALLGLVGFTSNSLIGANALFVADAGHNVIHLILGAILLFVAFRASRDSVFWLKAVGTATFLFGIIGLLAIPSTGGSLLGIAYSNGSSNWFHLVFGVAIFAAGMYGKDAHETETSPASPQSPNSQRVM